MAPMQRIALILLLYVLLMNGPHLRERPSLPATPITVQVDPLALPDAQVMRDYGPLRLTGLWQLRGSIRNFGGISSLLVAPDGHLTGLSDSGERMDFALAGGRGVMAALPRLPDKRDEENWKQDSESMTRDDATGRFWVGFERVQRICRYDTGGRIERCASPPEVRRWPKEGSLESLVRFGDGRFLAIGERANRIGGGFDALLWASDPVEPGTPPPAHLRYRGAPGYRPTDAIWLGGDRLLVLERRLTFFDGFTARLTLVRLSGLREGAELRGETIARFQRPGPADNMEALALGHDVRGGPTLYVASDDNHLALQRSLLFRFALPEDWVSDRAAP
ncbi:MAG: esterase-like activity of phytase family protein [Sphingobium sp.]|nr:esterase-like activity of phytase family protein [Sphingobium sp.]